MKLTTLQRRSQRIRRTMEATNTSTDYLVLPDETLRTKSTKEPWILAIDDDDDYCFGLQTRFSAKGIRFMRASGGMEGYRSAFEDAPAAILLDYHMPDGDGRYTLRRLKESPMTSDAPVIVITGRRDTHLKRQMLGAGAAEFLTKPVLWETLCRSLRKHTLLEI